ncbi:MAG: metal ABC transporter substrate-binding protein [Oscillospiraceae bacterium]
MKKTVVSLALLLLVLFSGCGGASLSSPARFTVVTTTYPVYLLTQMATEGIDGVRIMTMINQPISCPHEYSLTVDDMKTAEQADLLIQNGAGLEHFLPDLLAAYPDLPVLDSAEGVSLLPYQGHDADHGEDDPHIWMDPNRAAQMVETIGAGLAAADPENRDAYTKNAVAAAQSLREYAAAAAGRLAGLSRRELVTFHDGFGYLANAFDLTILKSIEEEAGSEVSAKELSNIVALVKNNGIPAVFREENGSASAANTIAKDAGVRVGTLTMMMNGSEKRQTPNLYYTLMDQNIEALLDFLETEGDLS